MWELCSQHGDSALASLSLLVPPYDLGSVASNAAQKTTPGPSCDIMVLNLSCSCWSESGAATFLLVPEVIHLQPFPSQESFFPNPLSTGSEFSSCCAIECSESWRRSCPLFYNIWCCADFPSPPALLQQLPSGRKTPFPAPTSQRSSACVGAAAAGLCCIATSAKHTHTLSPAEFLGSFYLLFFAKCCISLHLLL